MYILFLVVLLFFLFLQKIPEGFQIWKESREIDYWGNDLSFGIHTLRDCKKKCIQDKSCKVITTDYNDEGPGGCWVKSDSSRGIPASNRFSYILSRS